MATRKVLPYIINRNPTNLHRMRIANRVRGYQFEVDAAQHQYVYRFAIASPFILSPIVAALNYTSVRAIQRA
jgi:hypothetical protein